MYYGDQQLLGEEYRARLENNFCSRAIETGYVARAVELEKLGIISLKPKVKAKGLISFSWCSQKTLTTIRHLLKAIEEDFTQGFIQYWDLFVGPGEEGAKKEQLLNIIKSENNIRLCEFDVCYLTSIAESELAIAYAGYNTITDAFWANTKTIVISRENINFEQEMHACSLPEQCFTHLRENNVLSEELKLAFQRLLRSGNSVPLVNLCGAEITAKYLIRLASKHDQSES
jgi:predicted glycosyltransferase